jgi:hypothetical protein
MLDESFKPPTDITRCLSKTTIQNCLIERDQLNSDGDVSDCDTSSNQVPFATLKLGVQGHDEVLGALQSVVEYIRVNGCMTMSS